MNSILTEKNDIKIFILYLLRHIGYPLDFTSINDIMVQDGVVNYFDFAECFAELIDAGNIEEQNQPQGTVYVITPQGRDVSDSLQSDLLPMIREKSLKSAIRLLDFRKKGITTKRTYEPLEDGRFLFNCRLVENKKDILNISMVVDNKKMLDRILYNFDERPETFYRGLLSLATGEINYLL